MRFWSADWKSVAFSSGFADELHLKKIIKAKDDSYRFLDKKRMEGKPYHVYMTAGANKFLRIYYGTVKAYFRSLEKPEI